MCFLYDLGKNINILNRRKDDISDVDIIFGYLFLSTYVTLIILYLYNFFQLLNEYQEECNKDITTSCIKINWIIITIPLITYIYGFFKFLQYIFNIFIFIFNYIVCCLYICNIQEDNINNIF